MSGREENARTLAAIAGITPDEASSQLEASVVVTTNEEAYAIEFGKLLIAIIERTFEHCRFEPTGDEALEVVLGDAKPRLGTARIWVRIANYNLSIASQRLREPKLDRLPGAISVVAACYVAARVAKALLPDSLPHVDDPNDVDLREIGAPPSNEPFRIPMTYLAGAGAIGNSFLWTLKYFDVRGMLQIHDPDNVSDGNLNRQIYFQHDDIGHNKAVCLAERAQPEFPSLRLRPHPTSLQLSPAKMGNHRWLGTVVVGVDSRRARRHIQSELPKKVFDASTTGIEEVVLHFNEEPNADACMGCIYYETPVEQAREKHVATALGVSLEELQQNWISADAARRIAAKYPTLNADEITGEAYDSLFKALCGQQLLEHHGKQILAPFAFVSILAGALLAIEFANRHIDPAARTFNYWKISPWSRPISRLQRTRQILPECEFCNDDIYAEVRRELWS